MDIEKLTVKEILENWKELHTILANYKVELEDEKNNEELLDKYKNLKYKLLKIKNCINSLPEDTQNIVVDRYIKRYKWSLICKRYYISNNTVGRHLKIAHKQIEKLLAEEVQ